MSLREELRVEDLDAMPAAEAEALLLECGAAPRWVAGMMDRRPFVTAAQLRSAADDVWATLGPADWRAAFAAHPRIGERGGASSEREQSKVSVSSADARAALAAVNREYEARFGHIYIVSAAGKSAEELLRIARERLANDPAHELTVAGEELRKIMQHRLAKLLTHDGSEDS